MNQDIILLSQTLKEKHLVMMIIIMTGCHINEAQVWCFTSALKTAGISYTISLYFSSPISLSISNRFLLIKGPSQHDSIKQISMWEALHLCHTYHFNILPKSLFLCSYLPKNVFTFSVKCVFCFESCWCLYRQKYIT